MASTALESGLGSGLLYLALTAISTIIYFFLCSKKLYSGFPIAGPGASGLFGSLDEARKQWLEHGPSTIQKGLNQVQLATYKSLNGFVNAHFHMQVFRMLSSRHHVGTQNHTAGKVCERDSK